MFEHNYLRLVAVLLAFALAAPLVMAGEVSLPSSFPTYTCQSDNPAEGYIYFRADNYNKRTGAGCIWPMILDDEGNVVWFRKSYPDGNSLTGMYPFEEIEKFVVTDRAANALLVLDTTFTVVDTLQTPDGFDSIDGHDVILLPDGGYWLMLKDPQLVDMSTQIDGGSTEATVTFFTFQHYNSDHVMQWEYSTFDHIEELPVLDMDTTMVDPRASIIDHQHINAFDIDTDGNLLLSVRHYNEVIKINYDTKEIMWRWGGGKHNQFDFIDDLADQDSAFYYEHDIRVVGENRYMLFDNGDARTTPKSFAKEYILDPTATPPTATLIWSYAQNPQSYSENQGGVYPLANGNRIIGWGGTRDTDINITEVTPEGEIAFQLTFDTPSNARQPGVYRAYKVPFFGTAARPYLCADENDTSIVLYMNYFGHEANVESFDIYEGTDTTSATMIANVDSGSYPIEGLSWETRYTYWIKAVMSDESLSLFSNGWTFETPSGIAEDVIAATPRTFWLTQNWPNPFNPTTTIGVAVKDNSSMTVRVFDVLGRQVSTLYQGNITSGYHQFIFDGAELPSGSYFIRAETQLGEQQVRRITLMK